MCAPKPPKNAGSAVVKDARVRAASARPPPSCCPCKPFGLRRRSFPPSHYFVVADHTIAELFAWRRRKSSALYPTGRRRSFLPGTPTITVTLVFKPNAMRHSHLFAILEKQEVRISPEQAAPHRKTKLLHEGQAQWHGEQRRLLFGPTRQAQLVKFPAVQNTCRQQPHTTSKRNKTTSETTPYGMDDFSQEYFCWVARRKRTHMRQNAFCSGLLVARAKDLPPSKGECAFYTTHKNNTR